MLVIEPLNSLKDHKNYFLDNFLMTLELIQSIDSEHLKILYDIYHMQIMEGNIVETLKKYHEFIGYIHIANVRIGVNPGWENLTSNLFLKNFLKFIQGL